MFEDIKLKNEINMLDENAVSNPVMSSRFHFNTLYVAHWNIVLYTTGNLASDFSVVLGSAIIPINKSFTNKMFLMCQYLYYPSYYDTSSSHLEDSELN